MSRQVVRGRDVDRRLLFLGLDLRTLQQRRSLPEGVGASRASLTSTRYDVVGGYLNLDGLSAVAESPKEAP
jgi:hypothetical protein